VPGPCAPAAICTKLAATLLIEEETPVRNLCVSVLCIAAGCAHSAAASPQAAASAEPAPRFSASAFANLSAAAEEVTGRAFVEKLGAHDFAGASAHLAETFRSALPVEKLGGDWTGHESDWGPLIQIESVLGQPYAKGWGVLVVCRFEKGTHTLTLFFEPEGKIDALWYSPAVGAANLFVDALGYHHPELADTLSDADMHAASPPDKLAAAWSDIEKDCGTYQGIVHVTDRGANAEVVAAFGHRSATFNVVVNTRGRVVGFQVVSGG
jgi:hypothetical protein